MKMMRFLPRFKKAYRSMETLAEHETWTRAEIEKFQHERINAIWGHAITHVPYYRNLKSKFDLPPKFVSLAEFRESVPITPKEAVRNRPQDFLSERAQPGHWHSTSGSTGTPMKIFWASSSRQEMLRAKYRLQAMWNVDIFDPIAFLWCTSEARYSGLHERLVSIQRRTEDRLRNRIRLSPYQMEKRQLRLHLQRIASFRPTSIYAYSRAAYLLALEAEAAGFQCDSLKMIMLSAEPASSHMVKTIEGAFNVPAMIEYGSIECGLVAGEWTDRTLRVREDVIIAETVSSPIGYFDIILTPLTNPSFPLIRYAIGDGTDGELHLHEKGFATLGQIVGRNCDNLYTRRGTVLHPFEVADVLEFPKGSEPIQRYRVHQNLDGSITVKVEINGSAKKFNKHNIVKCFVRLTEGFPVTVDVVDRIPQTAAGKHRLITSEIIDFNSTACGA